MGRFRTLLTLFVLFAVAHVATAAASERRFALVIGNSSYTVRALQSPATDAVLIAQTLQASNFEVTSLRDLNEARLRQSFRDFVMKVKDAGTDAVVVVYFAGLGLQCEGENYLLPIEAEITQPADLVRHAVALSEQTHSLAALHLKASFVIIDAARASPFLLSGRPPASGLAWMEPDANAVLAFNATPGTVAPDRPDGHGAYAIALAEMMRRGTLEPRNLFDEVRLRVTELTGGAQVPWEAADLQTGFKFSERADEPKQDEPVDRTAWMRSQPMRKLSPDDAYWVALLRDTFDGYAEFIAEYWNDPRARQVKALLAARREAITWRRSYQANLPDAYWTYLERYPHGPHVGDAQQLLIHLGAAIAPPLKFRTLDYDVPPPLPDELEFTDQPVLSLGDPAFAFAPLKPPPSYFLGTQPPERQALAQTGAAPSEQNAPPTALLPGVSMPPQPPGRGRAGQADRGGSRANGSGGEGRAPSSSDVARAGAEPASNALSSPSALSIGAPAMPAAAQPNPSEQPTASPGPFPPAWASLLPKQGTAFGAPAPAWNGGREPLFVSAALAPVPSLAAREPGRSPANLHLGPHPGIVASAPSRQSPGSAEQPTGESTVIARPPSMARTGPRSLPGPASALATGSIASPTPRAAGQLSPGAQERPLQIPSEPRQSMPRQGALGTVAPAGGQPKPAGATALRPRAADHIAQDAVRRRKPELPPVSDPEGATPETAPQSEKNNPCTVANGRLDCDASR